MERHVRSPFLAELAHIAYLNRVACVLSHSFKANLSCMCGLKSSMCRCTESCVIQHPENFSQGPEFTEDFSVKPFSGLDLRNEDHPSTFFSLDY